MEKKKIKILAVVGPTASGKTDVGIALARAFDGEVIACDSRTIYRGMDIGTAKPPADDGCRDGSLTRLPDENESIMSLFAEKPRMIEGIPHWGFDLCNSDEIFTASQYQEYADKKIAEIVSRGRVPILVGGTGLYFSAVIDRPSFADVPPDPALRLELAEKTNEQLVEEIAERDPDAAETLDRKNRRRLERALEILRATGKRLVESRSYGPQWYDALQLGIEVDREVLYERINARVDSMIAHGLVDEVRKLREQYGDDAPGMTGIGYRQICAFLRNDMSLKDAIFHIKTDSRHYAKRQLTWFLRDNRIQWFAKTGDMLKAAQGFLVE